MGEGTDWRIGAVVRAYNFGSRGSWFKPRPGAVRCGIEQVTFTPCLVPVKPRKRWTDDRYAGTDCDVAGDYVVPNLFSLRDLVSRPDNMDETVSYTLHLNVQPNPATLLTPFWGNRRFAFHHFLNHLLTCTYTILSSFCIPKVL